MNILRFALEQLITSVIHSATFDLVDVVDEEFEARSGIDKIFTNDS